MQQMRRCCCNQEDQIELPIIDYVVQNKFEFEEKKTEDFCELKHKIICEFYNIIKSLECGKQPDLELILQEISLIYMNDERNTVFFK